MSWLLFALAVEWASESSLALLVGVMAIVYGTEPDALPAFLRLLKRSRWLLLSLGLLYGWTVNGAWLWPQLEGFSPTLEGLVTGGERGLRLTLLLAALALLLKTLTRNDLVYGLYLLAKPLTKIGFDRRAFAVRLALAMEWARTETCTAKTGLLDALRSALHAEEFGPEEVRFESRPLAWPDGLALAGMMTLLGLIL